MNVSVVSVTTHIEKFLSNLKKTAEVAVKYEENLDQYMTLAAEIAEIDLRNRQTRDVLQALDDSQTEEELQNAFHEVEGINFDDETIKRHKVYKDFERFVMDLLSKRMATAVTSQTVSHTTVGNDMEITETRNAIDPITKGPLLRPVRNTRCGHIYGYQSVMDSLAINPRLRCPMVGCSNKQFVNQNDLIEL